MVVWDHRRPFSGQTKQPHPSTDHFPIRLSAAPSQTPLAHATWKSSSTLKAAFVEAALLRPPLLLLLLPVAQRSKTKPSPPALRSRHFSSPEGSRRAPARLQV